MNSLGVCRNCGYLRGHYKTGLFCGSYLYILGLFLKANVQNGDIFWCVAKISNIILGMPDVSAMFRVKRRSWVQAYV